MIDTSIRDAVRQLRIELQIVNDKIATAAGLNPRDLDVLDVIDREGPCTPSHLAARTGLPRATLTGVLARLEQQQWVARERHPADGRSAQLRSTDRFDELRRLYRPMTDATKAVTDRLPPQERDLLERMLTDLVTAVRQSHPGAVD
ncbi:MarR family winged helix-turn-helix transcriptional regulator [Micropruina sp.]|uniref:MarR family winged helix-turn-helix transcriptional regulator n=1 Tax=Micropruina sp. TaxID=2737536 RepID=UPI0039E41F0A